MAENKFKVGDRVKVNYGHGWDGEGVIEIVNHAGINVRMDDGRIGGFSPRDITYIEAPFTIKAGGYYKTRDGRKVGPMEEFSGYEDKQWKFHFDGNTYTSCGRHAHDLREHSSDLIAEWVEPAAAPEPVAAIERKFKVGGRVTCMSNAGAPPWFTVGKTYTIIEVEGGITNEEDPLITCMSDTPGRSASMFSSRWAHASSPAIVARIDNGKPRPATSPYVHPDRASAEQEAARLAGINKGREFGVYEFVSSAKVEKTYEHEWQRLAAGGETRKAATILQGLTGMERSVAIEVASDFYGRQAA